MFLVTPASAGIEPLLLELSERGTRKHPGESLRRAMASVRGVREVHDLHVWTLTSGVVAMSAHAVAPADAGHQRVLEELHAAVERFGIHHATIQLEGEPLEACCPPAQAMVHA